jgi:heat shock protein HslJ
MKRSSLTLVLTTASVLLATTALAACGTTQSSSGDGEAPMELSGTSWNLSSYAGPEDAVVPAAESPAGASLTFAADGSWSGSTGCNRIMGTYMQDGSNLTIDSGPMTLMACEGPVADQETAIIAALPLVASFTAGDVLELRSAEDSVLLTYEAGLAGLAGTSWQATGVNNGKEAVVSQAGVEMATIAFDDAGQVSGSGGCNSFTGTYETSEPDGLTFGPLASTMKACADDVMQIEQEYFAALANVTTYQIEADRLTLRDASGATQVTFQQVM